MRLLAALAALAVGARAQTGPAAAPAPSTSTMVDLSTAAMIGAPAAPAVAPGAKTAGPPPDDRPIKVVVHKEAKAWQPVSVRAGGTPGDVTTFEWQVKTIRIKGKKRRTGDKSKAKAYVRLYPAGDDKRLVISIFPKKLEAQRTHLELRLLLIEGYLEKAQLFEVTAAGGGFHDDAAALEREGVSFQEESPESAQVRLTAVDPRPGKESFNAGLIQKALFPEYRPSGLPDLGQVEIAYSVYGVSGPAKPAKKKTRRR